MSIAVITADFNPFHNGHAYLIREALKHCGRAVVIMSGSFVQRGEPALIDKHRRARAALRAGADLVIELPLLYALAPAEIFARGAILTANALFAGQNTALVFGSESGDISYLKRLADAVSSRDGGFKETLMDALGQGMPYPKAMDLALSSSDKDPLSGYSLANSPNDILAAEYIRSLSITGSDITPLPVKRTEGEDIAHASDIRREPIPFDDRVLRFLPQYSLDEFRDISESGVEKTVCADDFSEALAYVLYAVSQNSLGEIADISGDLTNRILSLRRNFDCFTGFTRTVKTKAFTYARISRCLTELLLGITKRDRTAALGNNATYLRILGVRESSKDLLGQIGGSVSSGAPLIMRGADLHSERITGDPVLKRMIDLQLFADAIYDQKRLGAGFRISEEEKQPVII